MDIDTLGDIALGAGVSAVPHFVVFEQGLKVDECVGASPTQLRQLVSRHGQRV